MSTTRFEKTFQVEGTGPFPFDMLRFDECWPVGVADSAAMERAATAGHHVKETITLCTVRGLSSPTDGRWESFGWRVVEVATRERYRKSA